MKTNELVYSILDRLKLLSDDAIINEEHVLFLCKKYRSFLIKKEQDKEKGATDVASEFEYQQVCLDVKPVQAIDGICDSRQYLQTEVKLPKLLEGTVPRVYPIDYYQGVNVAYVSRDRMRFVGTNPYLQNIIYVSVGPDQHLYMSSNNPQFIYLKQIRVSALFEDFDEAAQYLCDDDGQSESCDVLDTDFPIRDYLVPPLMELVLRELSGSAYRPEDAKNNANDELASVNQKVQS